MAKNTKKKVTFKDESNNKADLKKEMARMYAVAERCGHDPDYRICDPSQYKELMDEVKGVQAQRRKAGAEKAQKTREKNKARGKTPHFITCPSCGAKSKKLYSEMGGLQTRVCQNGHNFEYDKWIAGRAVWGVILTGRVPDPYTKL